jgi:hypothetical protein
MAETIIGAAVIWGTDSVQYSGEITDSVNFDDEADFDEDTTDGDGFTSAVVMSNTRKQYSIELKCKTGTSLPALGTTITIAGQAGCIVKKVSKKWQRKKVLMANIDATYHPNVSLT